MTASVSSSNRFPVIEKYELHEEIGHGGMATVYRATDLRLEREVAVKVIHKHLRENTEVRSRFVAEARAVAKLRHPGIVDVYDVSAEEDEERYLVVELIRGKSLRQLLQDRQALPAEIAATMVARLCDAVEHAHASGVVHRDIKPENVLIELPGLLGPRSGKGTDSSGRSDRSGTSATRSGGSNVEVKLTDFGIAKVLDAQGVTSTGQILGSPAHMAPEQIEGGEVGPHTDVFALGVLLYECMVGHLPFEGKNPAQVLRRVLEGDYEPADTERPEVGGRWSRILAGALAHDIAERITSAGELGDLIEAELAALGVDDQQGDLNEFIADARAYAEKSKDRMVPRLLARGEHERKKGNVFDAAADFNRALALRPDDLAILKRVSTLSAERVWRERGMRLGAIVLGAAALCGAAFGITKAFKPTWNPLASNSSRLVMASASGVTPTTEDRPDPRPQPDIEAQPSPEPSSSDSAHGPAPAPPNPSTSASSGASDVLQAVVFRVVPGHVKIQVAGRWISPNARSQLPVGSHSVVISDSCCDPYTGSVQVAEQDGVQLVTLPSLAFKPASVALTGAPDTGTIKCATAAISGKGGSVEMDGMAKEIACTLSNGNSVSVKLTAGMTSIVEWR